MNIELVRQVVRNDYKSKKKKTGREFSFGRLTEAQVTELRTEFSKVEQDPDTGWWKIDL